MGLHSGVDAPGGRDTRAPSGAQKSLQGGSRLLTGHRGVPLRGAGSMSNDPPPAIIPEAVHATGGARGFTSSEPCSTTSPPGSFPAAHVARTELNDRQPGTVPAASGPFSGLGWYSVAHPDTTPPTRQPFHPQSAAHHPRTGHPHPHAGPDTTADKLPALRPSLSSIPEPLARRPPSASREQPQILVPNGPCGGTFVPRSTAGSVRGERGHPTLAVDHEVGGDKPDTKCRQVHDRPGRGGSTCRPGCVARGGREGARRGPRRSCSSSPPRVPFAWFAGHQSARSRAVAAVGAVGAFGAARGGPGGLGVAVDPGLAKWGRELWGELVDLGVVAPRELGLSGIRGATTPRSAVRGRGARGRQGSRRARDGSGRGRFGGCECGGAPMTGGWVLPLADPLTVKQGSRTRPAAARWDSCDF